MKVLTLKKLMLQEVYRLCSYSDFTWRYIANLRPWVEYHRIRKPLDGIYKQLSTNLKRDGIALTSVAEIMGNTPLFKELENSIWKYEASLRAEIDKARVNLHNAKANKSYVFALLGPFPVLDPNNIFVRFAVQPEVLKIANDYFDMLTKLRYYNVWHNFPTGSAPRESQLWHRDPEDRAVLKMFVYLTDIDEKSGPLSYVPGTHPQGMVKIAPGSKLVKEGRTYVRRTDDVQMNAVAPRAQWITACGPKGTVVLADTRGYHKGGWVREGERILYTCMFTSQASTSPEIFKRQLPIPTYRDTSVTFALGG
jgi:hypothetical protein